MSGYKWVVNTLCMVSFMLALGCGVRLWEARRVRDLNRGIETFISVYVGGPHGNPHADSISRRLDQGGDIHTRCPFNYTVLMYATFQCLPELAIRAIAAGADVNFKNDAGATAMAYACTQCGDPRIVEILLNAGAREHLEEALYNCSSSGYIEAGRLLLEAGADPNHDLGKGYTPLLTAAEHDQVEMLELLLEHGARPASESELRELRRLRRRIPSARVASLVQRAIEGSSSK